MADAFMQLMQLDVDVLQRKIMECEQCMDYIFKNLGYNTIQDDIEDIKYELARYNFALKMKTTVDTE